MEIVVDPGRFALVNRNRNIVQEIFPILPVGQKKILFKFNSMNLIENSKQSNIHVTFRTVLAHFLTYEGFCNIRNEWRTRYSFGVRQKQFHAENAVFIPHLNACLYK